MSLFLAEAARVALGRHHRPPVPLFVATDDADPSPYQAVWQATNSSETASHGNTDDATEYGAYCLAIAAVELKFQLFAVARTERKTGADYWVDSEQEPEDIENSRRLEVSGTDEGTIAKIRSRLTEKVEQTKRGSVTGSAIAVVVGFSQATILLRSA